MGIKGRLNNLIENVLKGKVQSLNFPSLPMPQCFRVSPRDRFWVHVSFFIILTISLKASTVTFACLLMTPCARNWLELDQTLSFQQDIDKLDKSEERWMMEFHPKKCQLMCASKKRKKDLPNVIHDIHDHTIENVNQVKYLGVTFSSDLKWDVGHWEHLRQG